MLGYNPAYAPLAHKDFASALRSLITKEFPHIGGPLVVDLFIEQIKEMIEKYYPPRERLRMGQLLWFAVARDEKMDYKKTMASLRLVPVVLSIVTPEDIDWMIHHSTVKKLVRELPARLYREAAEQGGILSEGDVAIITKRSLCSVGTYTRAYEKTHQCVLPRRGTIHDIGRSISHKGIICRKRRGEGKSTTEVALETGHTPESVTRYTQDLDRVAYCLKIGLSVETTSFVTGLSKNLVLEYQQVNKEIEAMKEENLEEHWEEPPF